MSFAASNERYVPYQSIEVPSTNGLSYQPSNQSIIHLEIPDFINFIDPEQTYLKLDLQLAGAPAPLVCREHAGVNSCIQRIRILSGDGVLIEEIDDYNVWVANRMKYENDEPENLKRTFTEGTYDSKDIRDQPYFIMGGRTAAADVTAVTYNTNTFCIPLRTGLFESRHILPIAAMGGLRIEIHLVQDPRKALSRHPCQSQTTGEVLSNQSTDGVGDGLNPTAPVANASTDLYYQGRLTAKPVVAGNKDVEVYGCQFGQDGATTAPYAEGALNANNPWRAGDVAQVYDKDNLKVNTADFPVTNLSYENPQSASAHFKMTGGAGFATPTFAADDNSGPYKLRGQYSTNGQETTAPNFTISNVAMVCGQITPGSAYEGALQRRVASGEGLSIDIKSIQEYKQTLASSITTSSTYLPIVNSRIYSIFTIPTIQESYSFASGMNADEHVLLGLNDTISQYQWYYDGQLHPNRRVPCCANTAGGTAQGGRGKGRALGRPTDTSNIMEQHHFYELVKAWENCGYRVRDIRGANKAFVMGRALSKYGQTYDARGKDFQLNIERTSNNETAAGSTLFYNSAVDLLLHTFVCHLRRLRVTPTGVEVDL